MKFGKIAAALAATIVAGSASAADLPSRKVAPVLAAAPAFSWTGAYIGVNAGLAAVTREDSFFPAGTLLTAPFLGSPSWRGVAEPTRALPLVGGQIGFNWQATPSIVLGAEADFQGLFGGINASSLFSPAAGTVFSGQFNGSVPWLATVRGRLGVTPFMPNLMFYATGGVAFAKVNDTSAMLVTLAGAPLELFPLNFSSTRTTWTIGAGAEWALWNNFSLKAEWLYVDLKKRSGGVNTVLTTPPALASDIMGKSSGHSAQIFRLGLNYQFRMGGAGPVVASY